MKTKKLLFTALMSAVLVGCSQDDSLRLTDEVPVVYTGSMEKTASRVLMDQNYMMKWEMGDELSIFPKYDINNQYKVVAVDNGVATFEYVDYVENPAYSALANTYAVYPYYADNKIEGEVITTTVPTEVDYTGMESSIKHALMSSKSASQKLNFTNAQGILRLRLNAVTPFMYGPIKSIKLESATKKLSGTATIDYTEGDTPVAKIADGENYLLINLSEALQVDLPAKKSNEYAEFYIPVVPTEFEKNDVKMTITWKNGGTYEKEVGIAFNIERKKIYTLRHTIGGAPIYGGELEGAEEVTVETADELIEALENGGDILMKNDIKIDPAGMSNAYGTTGINVKNGQTIDGGGNILDIKGAGGTWDSGINTTGGLIKNITVTGSFRGIFINHNSTHSEKVVLENVIIDGTTYTISCDQGLNQGFEATNSTFNGWTSYAGTLGNAKFINCKFGEGNGYAFCRPYAPTEFVGCEFEAGYVMDARAAVTFENCTLDGVAITDANLATLVAYNTANASVK